MIKTITSAENDVVKHLAKLRVNRDYRHEHQSLVIAGIKPCHELIQDYPIKTVLAYDETYLPHHLKADNIFIVNEAIMKKVSGMQAPEGLLIEIAMPKPADLKGKKKVVALDGINDPGNLGTLLRTALALGWEAVFILENSCDPYNDKALRAARGATFRLPIHQGTWKELHQMTEKYAWTPLVADLHGTVPENLPKHERTLLVLSNESHGVSEEAEALCTKVSIPMTDQMESLNVSIAGGILMYLLKKG